VAELRRVRRPTREPQTSLLFRCPQRAAQFAWRARPSSGSGHWRRQHEALGFQFRNWFETGKGAVCVLEKRSCRVDVASVDFRSNKSQQGHETNDEAASISATGTVLISLSFSVRLTTPQFARRTRLNSARREFSRVRHHIRMSGNSAGGNLKRTIEATVWDAADGFRLRSTAASFYGPRAAKSTDGKLWFVTGEGVQVIDPRHLPFNKLPPPVRFGHGCDHRRRDDQDVTALRIGKDGGARMRRGAVQNDRGPLPSNEKACSQCRLEQPTVLPRTWRRRSRRPLARPVLRFPARRGPC
jgi:hypothetical protein